MTSFVKVFVLWEQRWWDDCADNFCSKTKRHLYTFLLDDEEYKEHWRVFLEVLPLGRKPSNDVPESRMLCFTAVGAEGLRVQTLTDEQVTDEIMRKLQKAYPEKIVPHPIDVYVPRWDLDPLFLGAFSFKPVSKLNQDSEMQLKSPVKCDNHAAIWFAGEAYHNLYGGYLQAAYLSG